MKSTGHQKDLIKFINKELESTSNEFFNKDINSFEDCEDFINQHPTEVAHYYLILFKDN